MRTKILPPDFVTRFRFLRLRQLDFVNRLVKHTLHDFSRCLQCLRQHVQKLFRSFEVAVAQGVYPTNPFCNVFVTQSLCKLAARETEHETIRLT